MPDLNLCPRCGGPLPNDGALAGGCPRCMLELGFESSMGSRERLEQTAASERPAVIGRYRVLRLIGEGGMGAVYEAEQDHPRRTVALKIIKSGMAAPELLRRFEQESQALGRLQHPGIAQIYEAGTVNTGFGPQPYFAMEFIHGQSPRDYAEANHLNARDRLRMMIKICDAVHHAHQRGLIHRDLKPGNIVVDEAGQPKILDFGVARVTDSDSRATLQTDLGQLIGTLAYMSPEQALADPLDLDTRSDVYSLGVILYELLSGRLPYAISKKVHEAIQAIREEDPARLSTSNRTYRGDVETIVAKALEKERDRRYASAAEMAADIQRYLNDEPIVARRASTTYQLKKFARRNTALVTGVVAVFVLLVAAVTVIAWYATRVTAERHRANNNEQKAIQASIREGGLRLTAEALRVQAVAQTVVLQQALNTNNVNLYFKNIALAEQELAASNTAHVDQLLDEALVARQNWEWNYLKRLNHMEDAVMTGHRAAVLAMVLSRDGKRFRTIDASGTFKDWDLATRKEIATGVLREMRDIKIDNLSLSTDGSVLYLDHGLTSSGVSTFIQEVWDLSTRKSVFSLRSKGSALALLEPNGTQFLRVAVSPDGMRIIAGSTIIVELRREHFILRTWDIGTGNELTPLYEYDGKITGVVFSPSGDKVAVVRNSSTIILDGITGVELAVLNNSRGYISDLAFSHDSTTIAVAIDEDVREWNTADGQERWSVSTGPVTRLAFSPDSHFTAVALADRTIRILNSTSGREELRETGHTGTIRTLSFTPDSRQLLSAGDDKIIRIWSLRSLIPDKILEVGRIEAPLQVSPDTVSLLTTTGYGLKSWDLSTGLLKFESRFIETGRQTVFSKNSNRIVSLNKTDGKFNVLASSNFQVLDAQTGSLISTVRAPIGERNGPVGANAFQVSPSGDRAALVIGTGQLPPGDLRRRVVYLWDLVTGKPNAKAELDNGVPGSVSFPFQFSRDGNLAAFSVAAVVRNGVLIPAGIDIYSTTTGRRQSRLNVAGIVKCVFSPDGNSLLVIEGGRSMTIWDVRTGMKLVSFPEAGNPVTTLMSTDLSPNGTRLVSVSSDGEVWLWDAGLGKALIQLRKSSGPYQVREVTVIAERYGYSRDATQRSISFSADGRNVTLVTVTPDPKGARIRIETWDGSPLQKQSI